MNRGPAAYAALLLVLTGLGLLALGWVGSSGRAELDDQKGYVLLAALGLITAAAGATVALSSQRRHLAQRSDELQSRIGAWLEEAAR